MEIQMSTPITDVGIDMDGVLYPFINSFRSYCEERLGRLFLEEPKHWNFFEDWGLDASTFQEWLRDSAKTHKVFGTQMPYPTVLEAWELLRKNNIKIHVMTARPQEAWAQTAEWLEKYGLVADSLHFNPTKGFLANLTKGRAAILDDHIAFYEEAEKAGIFPCLLNQPWNQELKNANRASTVLEFANMIVGYNKVISSEAKPKGLIEKHPSKLHKQFPEPHRPFKKEHEWNPNLTKWNKQQEHPYYRTQND
jgi:hypothetical protein